LDRRNAHDSRRDRPRQHLESQGAHLANDGGAHDQDRQVERDDAECTKPRRRANAIYLWPAIRW
jgi:hypothetical protein